MEYTVIHRSEKCRFEATIEDTLAYVEYEQPSESEIKITHTIVPQPIEGRGIAAILVKTALEYAHNQHLEVSSTCSYATIYIKRHPELL